MVKIAYICMEYMVRNDLPIYSGGLGNVASTYLKAGADLEKEMIGFGIAWDKGYFTQRIVDGNQIEEPVKWNKKDLLEKIGVITCTIETTEVFVDVWKYEIKGRTGHIVPLYLFSTDNEHNEPWVCEITNKLYESKHPWFRLAQETILGKCSVYMMESVIKEECIYHLNEGHGFIAPLEYSRIYETEDIQDKFTFTTHTPVIAGHDRFNLGLIEKVIPEHTEQAFKHGFERESNMINTTLVCLSLSKIANGVAEKHTTVSKEMFPQFRDKFVNVTNGVHLPTWKSEKSKEHNREILKQLIFVSNKTPLEGLDYDTNKFTIGFARRMNKYKRPDLLFYDLKKLENLNKKYPFRLVFSGKSHPSDIGGKDKIYTINEIIKKTNIEAYFIENYDMQIGKILTRSVDLWLNTPKSPLEASGTSIVKALINGVPVLSSPDGWVLENKGGVIFFGKERNDVDENNFFYEEAVEFYEKLEYILSIFYKEKEKYNQLCEGALRNVPYGSAERVVLEYYEKMWKV